MKKSARKMQADLRAEYDFASMKGEVRGKYAKQYRAGTNFVLLEPELARAFPNEPAVNNALRAVLRITEAVEPERNGSPKGRRKPRRASVAR